VVTFHYTEDKRSSANKIQRLAQGGNPMERIRGGGVGQIRPEPMGGVSGTVNNKIL